VAEALRDNLHRHAVREQQAGMGVAEVVQPDRRQLFLSERPASPDDVADEAAREPLGVSAGAVEVAE
jgi:hypothetical protein